MTAPTTEADLVAIAFELSDALTCEHAAAAYVQCEHSSRFHRYSSALAEQHFYAARVLDLEAKLAKAVENMRHHGDEQYSLDDPVRP